MVGWPDAYPHPHTLTLLEPLPHTEHIGTTDSS